MSRQNFPTRVPKSPQEVERFFLAVIDFLKGTPQGTQDLENLFWLLHEDRNADLRRTEFDATELRKLYEADTRHTMVEIEKALDWASALALNPEYPDRQENEKQHQDALILHYMEG